MFKKKKIKTFVCVLLAVSVVFAPSVDIAAQGLIFDNQGIYEEQSTNVRLRFMLGIFYDGKPLQGGKAHIIFDFSIIFSMLFMVDDFSKPDITILGEYNDIYYYVNYNGQRGYIPKFFISGNIDYKYIELSRRHLVLYQNDDNVIRITNKRADGTVSWKSSNTDIVTVKPDGDRCIVNATSKIGVATVTASVGDVKEKCYVCVVDKWKYGWKTKTVAEAQLYNFPASPKESIATLPAGTTVTVYGDCQSANKYCYVKYNDGSKDHWGFVHIRYLSNRGAYFNDYGDFGWTYPVDKEKYITLSSYYGQRSKNPPYEHKGIDIVGTTSGAIQKAEVKAVCDAYVLRIDNKNSTTAGNYVALEATNCVDPLTGEKIRIIYMHLRHNIQVSEEQVITAGTPIGYVSNSGGTESSNDDKKQDGEMGFHLHFEVTTHGDTWNYRSFGNSVNPLWFYPDIEFETNQASSWYGMYWSNDKTETKIDID